MRSFGGRVECQSKLGEFTEFKLYFPVVPNAPKAATLRTPYFNDWKQSQTTAEDKAKADVQPVKQAGSGSQAPTVLIVDDKEIQRTLVQMYLTRLGVNSIQAKNGENAIELCRTNQVDLILMDVQMPVMNGFDASQVIKARSPHVPIIALSGESGQYELDMIRKLMDGRLEKPTSLDALQHVLDNWLSNYVKPNAFKVTESD